MKNGCFGGLFCGARFAHWVGGAVFGAVFGGPGRSLRSLNSFAAFFCGARLACPGRSLRSRGGFAGGVLWGEESSRGGAIPLLGGLGVGWVSSFRGGVRRRLGGESRRGRFLGRIFRRGCGHIRDTSTYGRRRGRRRFLLRRF